MHTDGNVDQLSGDTLCRNKRVISSFWLDSYAVNRIIFSGVVEEIGISESNYVYRKPGSPKRIRFSSVWGGIFFQLFAKPQFNTSCSFGVCRLGIVEYVISVQNKPINIPSFPPRHSLGHETLFWNGLEIEKRFMFCCKAFNLFYSNFNFFDKLENFPMVKMTTLDVFTKAVNKFFETTTFL